MPEADRNAIAVRLRAQLIRDAQPGGGWGYFAGKSARIEPTAWALLALAGGSDLASADWRTLSEPHLTFLARCQQSNGLLIEDPRLPPNFTANGVAACALQHAASGRGPSLSALLSGLVAIKGIAVDDPDPRQNNRLQGWPWLPDTFSWVEPTCWCVLALKKTRTEGRSSAATARIQEAEQLLANRSCDVGGWNFGNASALGQDLRPYVPTTALGLLALQDRRVDPVVTRSLGYLEAARVKEPSGMALALTAVSLRVMDRPAADVEQRLAEDADRIERMGNLQTIAMTVFALTADRHDARALRV